jgi:hypothetical protein
LPDLAPGWKTAPTIVASPQDHHRRLDGQDERVGNSMVSDIRWKW